MKWLEDFLIKYGLLKRHCPECGGTQWELSGFTKRLFRRCLGCTYCQWIPE